MQSNYVLHLEFEGGRKEHPLEMSVMKIHSDTTIGAYTIGVEIGKGLFATVYKCVDNRTHAAVAIKLIVRSKLKLRKLIENLEVEISILKTMKHPHIVGLLDYHQTLLHFHLVMDYCSMGDLLYFIRKRNQLVKTHPVIALMLERYPLVPPELPGLNPIVVVHFLQQLSLALSFLREKLLVHRDIKPQNLLLCPPAHLKDEFDSAGYSGLWLLPILKIADFGFARVLPATLMAETLCGLPLYMAPEILRYEKYNAKADLWSVGAVAYEMACGRPPFKAANHIELLKTIERAHDRIKFPAATAQEVPDSHKRLIRLLLKYNPTERVSFNEFFADEVIVTPLVAPDGPLAPDMDENLYISEYISPLKPLDHLKGPPRELIELRIVATPQGMTTSPDKHLVGKNFLPQETKQNSPVVTKETPNPLEEQRIMQLIGESSPGPHGNGNAPFSQGNTSHVGRGTPESVMDYVVVEKRAVEVNAIADAINNDKGAASESVTSTANQIINRRRLLTDRRISINILPLTLSKAIGMALNRLFGLARTDSEKDVMLPNVNSGSDIAGPLATPTSGATFSTVISSPPNAVAQQLIMAPAFPAPATADTGLTEPVSNLPTTDSEVLHRLEQLATKAHAINLFADVKFSQLIPLRPDDDGTALDVPAYLPPKVICQIGEEGVALYVKTLSLLAHGMEVASSWWYASGDTVHPSTTHTGLINDLVQWIRDRFNEALERAEYIRLRLDEARRELEPENDENGSSPTSNNPAIASKLIFERALEMLRNAAINELVKEDLKGCELAYATAIWMLEALLDHSTDDDAVLDTQDRQMVEKFITSIGNRLAVLRKKLEIIV